MPDAASVLISPQPAPTARAPKPVPDQGTLEDQGNPSGFSDLLEAIEKVALDGEQGPVADGETPAPPAATVTVAGVTMLLDSLAQKSGQSVQPLSPAAGATIAGQAATPRVTAFSEIRPLLTPTKGGQTAITPSASGSSLKPSGPSASASSQGPAIASQLTPATPLTPLTPAQAAALSAIEEAQVPHKMQPTQAGHAEASSAKIANAIASTPRLEAIMAQAASPETANPVVRQVATNLQFIARGEMERLRIDLHPKELGRVQVQLQKSGAITRVLVVTETAQAFEALKAGAGGLQQSLAQAGFEADDVFFESREDRGEGRQAEADERRERQQRQSARDDAEETRELVVRYADIGDRTVLL